MKKEHQADSSPHRLAEIAIRKELEKSVGFILHKEKIPLGNNLEIEVDAANREERFYCEICARLGKLLPAHLETVPADILKLLFIEKSLGFPCQKNLCFADTAWKKFFEGKSWIAAAAKSFDVHIVVVNLPEEILLQIFAAQRRQKMVHVG